MKAKVSRLIYHYLLVESSAYFWRINDASEASIIPLPSQSAIEHNNRTFIAKNVDVDRISENIVYKCQDVREAYNELFRDSLKEYNEKQKQPCRRIKDYYEHIKNSNREEAFYEAIVQFGDSIIAPCGSENGEVCKKMLDEYLQEFQVRNPNLHIFKATPHNPPIKKRSHGKSHITA